MSSLFRSALLGATACFALVPVLGQDIDARDDARRTSPGARQGAGAVEQIGREHGYFYDPQTGDWEYGWYFDPYAGDYYRPEQFGYTLPDAGPPDTATGTPSFRFGYEVRGTVGEIEALRASGGQLLAADLSVRTDRGRRRVHLGSAFLDPAIPSFRQDDQIRVSGRMVEIAGDTFFKVAGIANVSEGPLYPWPSEEVLTGRITDFGTLYVEEGRPRAVLIDFRTDDGTALELLLGTTVSLLQPRARLSTGVEVVARGFVADQEGQRRFVAQRIATPQRDPAARADRDSRAPWTADRSTRRAPAFVRGRLTSLTPTRVRGEEHLLAQIEEFDGRIRTVNLGSVAELERLDPRLGERVVLLGFRDSLDGRPLLTAHYLQLHDRTAAVNHAAAHAHADDPHGGHFAAGEILELQPLEQNGPTTMLALVGLDSGGTAEILLGSRTLLEPLNVQIGSEILVHGYPTRVRGRTVLQAHHVRAADQTVAVGPSAERRKRRAAPAPDSATDPNRSDPTDTHAASFADQPAFPDKDGTRQVKRYTGEILSLRPAEFVGFEQPHLLATVRMLTNGGEISVDLGPQRDLESLNLAPGDQITVRGATTEINSATGFVAYELLHNGQRIQIHQPQAESKARQRE